MPSKRLETLNYEEKGILDPTRGRSFIYMVLLFLLYKSLFFWIPLHKDLHFPFIFTQKLSSSYTWMRLSSSKCRMRLHFWDFRPIQNIYVKLLLCNLSCAITVHGYFLINAVRGVVILHLMRRR